MRSYLDIIIDLKDGKKPDYEEVRLACLMANSLLHFSEETVKRITGYSTDKQKTDLVSLLEIKGYEQRFNARKLSTEEYLGNWHPDAPGRQEERQRHQKIFDNLMRKVEGDKENG